MFLKALKKRSVKNVKLQRDKNKQKNHVNGKLSKSKTKKWTILQQLRKSDHNYTYIPSDYSTNSANKRIIVIDGSNVAYAHARHAEFSVRGIEIALEFFIEQGFQVKAVVPEMRLTNCNDPKKLLELNHKNGVIFTPCKNLPHGRCTTYDDRIILEIAARLDGVVITNDNFKDLIGEYDNWKEIIKNRVVGYTFYGDLFMLPKDPYGPNGPNLYDILLKN